MRLALRLALTFGFLAAASSALVGVTVRYHLVATETERFRDEVRGICERIRDEVHRQADADRALITGFCEANELVADVGMALDKGEMEERGLSFLSRVQTERKALGMDELLVGVEKGDLIGYSPPSLIGMPRAEVDALIRGDASSSALRTNPVPAIVVRCTHVSQKGRLVGMVAARHVDPTLNRIARTLGITVVPSWPKYAVVADHDGKEGALPSPTAAPNQKGKHAKAAPSSKPAAPAVAPPPSASSPGSSSALAGGAERASCRIEDSHGAALPFEIVKSTHELEANVAEVDRAIGILAIMAAAPWLSSIRQVARSAPPARVEIEPGDDAEGGGATAGAAGFELGAA
ncbi:MAG TPA: hypothetical protein VM925_37650, partial [Labilithrix sp.]|nr:hypothetical protein [Labilithrix sp.]